MEEIKKKETLVTQLEGTRESVWENGGAFKKMGASQGGMDLGERFLKICF